MFQLLGIFSFNLSVTVAGSQPALAISKESLR